MEEVRHFVTLRVLARALSNASMGFLSDREFWRDTPERLHQSAKNDGWGSKLLFWSPWATG